MTIVTVATTSKVYYSEIHTVKQSSCIQFSSLIKKNGKFVIQFINIINTASIHAFTSNQILNQIFIVIMTFTHKFEFLIQYSIKIA